jgi:hypothetical protein
MNFAKQGVGILKHKNAGPQEISAGRSAHDRDKAEEEQSAVSHVFSRPRSVRRLFDDVSMTSCNIIRFSDARSVRRSVPQSVISAEGTTLWFVFV